ncbi:MAG: Ig-like domain-containing protein [Myxococcales bacterium]|nr:Ig-like domain-containing protein [Myxococcales bacterium]
MRALLLVSVLLFACTGPAGPQGDQGEPGAPGARAPSLVLSPPALEVEPGATALITARAVPEEAVTWAVTNPAVATVESGVVTGVAAGTTFVTATSSSGNATGFVAVLVRGTRRYPAISYARDIEPLFRQADLWYPGAPSCDSCHFSGNDNSGAELELASYSGLLAGAWGFTEPAKVRSVLGESRVGAKDFDWDRSILRRRLREHRMPPEGPFSVQNAGRDGPAVAVDGGTTTAVELIGAWVAAGAPETQPFAVSPQGSATFAADVLPLFTRQNVWFAGAPSCDFCHFQSTPRASSELRLRDYAGLMTGARSRTQPPGVSILGESAPGQGDFDWDDSILKRRLRDERMPPGMPFDRNGAFTDGPLLTHPVTGAPVRAVELLGEWVRNGARND